ncbi:MAG TPA: GspH/FimT family pseudopilin [Thermoanaerobaculia bacterium]|nr:GspH/FimT family pseudopilin [Thermoanaerobaculia bacterium]
MTHLRKNSAPEAGYSMVESLVVVAIIGMISLVAIPNLVAINNGNKLKASLRLFTNDVRLARQRAVTRTRQVKLSLSPGSRSYYIYQRPVTGGAWTQVTPRRTDCPKVDASGPFPNGCLGDTVTFSATTFADITDADDTDTMRDVIYTQSGGVANIGTPPNTITIQSVYNNLATKRYVVSLSVAGNVTSN